MSSAFCLSNLVHTGRRGILSSSNGQHIQQQLRYKHKVRVIITRDLPEGQMRGVYAGEVHNVAAGFARNFLIPQKMAVYATPRNFDRCGLIDPDVAAKEELATRMGEEESEDLKAADILRRYLRNKSVRMIRNVDPSLPTMCHPGHVSAKHLRDKLSKQLKIDLETHETIHIRNEPVVDLEAKDEQELMELIREMDKEDPRVKEVMDGDENGGRGEGDAAEKIKTSNGDETVNDAGETVQAAAGKDGVPDSTFNDCDTTVKQLGEYIAKITLAGGYLVPLKFKVERR